MWRASEGKGGSAWGWPVLGIGLLLYVLGRSLQILMCVLGSLVWPEGNQIFAVEAVPLKLTSGFPRGDLRELYYNLPLP